jgi:prophage tail gpP-like protein
MSAYIGPDDVSITVGTTQIAGWETVEIGRSVEACPNHFTLTMTEQFSNNPSRIIAYPGQPCQIKIGKNLVVTGYIDRYAAKIGPTSHDVTITGRGLCEDIVDCSADPSTQGATPGGTTLATDALDLAKKLCKPFNIEAIINEANFLPSSIMNVYGGPQVSLPIRPFQIGLGDTPYQIIEQVARYTGLLVYEDEFGRLVLDRIGTQKMGSGFVQGDNVEGASMSLSVDERFTSLTIVFSPINQLDMTPSSIMNVYGGPTAAAVVNQRCPPFNDGAFAAQIYPRKRPRIVVSMQNDGSSDFAERMAAWEMNRRIGRSQAVQLTCDSWRDKNGLLWQPNWLANVHLPALKLVNMNWIIGDVVFRRDQGGTHADLVLMPPSAFSVQPGPLNVFEYELASGLPTSQSPAPPTTGASEPSIMNVYQTAP